MEPLDSHLSRGEELGLISGDPSPQDHASHTELGPGPSCRRSAQDGSSSCQRPRRSAWRLKEGAAPPSWCGTPPPTPHQIQWAEPGSASPRSDPCKPSSCSQPQGWVEGTEGGSPPVTLPWLWPGSTPQLSKARQGLSRALADCQNTGSPHPKDSAARAERGTGHGLGIGRTGRVLPRKVDLSFSHLAQQHPATSWPSPSPGEQDTSPPALSPGQPTSTHLQVPGGPWQADWLGSGAIKGGEGWRGTP